MPELNGAGDGATTPLVADKGQGKDETVSISKADLAALTRDRDEARQSEKAWADFHRSGAGTRTAPEPIVAELPSPDEFADPEGAAVEAIENDTPEKMVDDLAAHGVAALSKRGFITAADALKLAKQVAIEVSSGIVDRRVAKMGTDQQIMQEFPDLRNQESELFQETAKRYQRAIAMDPNAKKTPAALYLAADAAREAIKGRTDAKTRETRANESDDDRRARIDAQDGRARGRGAVDDDSDFLGDEARQVIKAFGLTDAEFKTSQKETSGGGRSNRGRK